ncbi:carbohydrate sulfotransferase 1-like [Xyrauchen texanus]|uniref:carbohydrate sulfotransferase 1-like n=1 Tax=Xyrauchen texanus TaxID=154827 RepID=UPI002242A465|nr:carbohydrate sulfotransferase 1-like [Xyrauchen texanus]
MQQETLSLRKNHVIILTSTRCGSSFLGQIFNYKSDVFYLYEPLQPVKSAIRSPGKDNRHLFGASRDLLRSLLNCDLYKYEDYIYPPPEEHILNKMYRRGASRALCSPPVCNDFKPQEVSFKESDCVETCGKLNMSLAIESCQKKGNVVLKIVFMPPRIIELKDLLEDPRLNLKVIQLVRDPRAILSSRLDIRPSLKPYQSWNMLNKGEKTSNVPDLVECEEFQMSVVLALSKPYWLRGRYMLLRYEDLTLNPFKKAQEIYDYVNIQMDDTVLDWIKNNTQAEIKHTFMNQYETKRNSSETVYNWRSKLSFAAVKHLQDKCKHTLQMLGYKQALSQAEINDLSFSLLEELPFEPFV